MVREVAELTIDPAAEPDFLAAVEKAVPLFQRAKGCGAMRLERVVETPGVYRLIVEWETIDNHMVDFRGSEDFNAWRGLVGGFFKGAPKVDHTEVVVAGFGG